MIKQSKWLVIAMVVSVVLITAFQLYWISNSYQAEQKNLQVESTIILREVFYEKWRGKKGHSQQWEDMESRRRYMLPQSHLSDSAGFESEHSVGEHRHFRGHKHRHENLSEPSSISRLQPDSLQLVFGPKLREIYPSFNSKIIIQEPGDTLPPPVGTMRTLPLNWDWSKGQTLCAEITGSGPVLFRKVVPHIATSLVILITITGTMLLLYRTSRRSNKLAYRQRQFVSDVTHELKTPIATVSIALEAMKSFLSIDNKEKTQEYLEISAKELKRLTTMVERMLQLNHMESGRAQLSIEKCDLNQIARECVESLREMARQKGIELSLEPSEHPCVMWGDILHLSSALSNLIENSIKYSPADSYVKVQVRDEGNQCSLRVTDNGPGIDREEHQRIFEKFYRIRSGDRHNVKGYGLGLSYVKEVAQLHNGKVLLESSPGRGSVFTIIIPK